MLQLKFDSQTARLLDFLQITAFSKSGGVAKNCRNENANNAKGAKLLFPLRGRCEHDVAKAFGKINEKQQKAVKQIMESAHFLTKTVNDLLDEAQIESRAISLHNEYFSPVDLMSKVKTSVETLASRKSFSRCGIG